MPTNDFKSFASDGATNLVDLATYDASATRKLGAVSGPAASNLLNRAWRQPANMASALGAAIIAQTPADALDNGDIPALRDSILALVNSARVARFAIYTSNTTWTVPDEVYTIRLRGWSPGGGGGGAQGGGAAGGGGSGTYAEGIVAVTPGDDIVVEIGARGAAGSASGGSSGANSGGQGGDLYVYNDTTTTDLLLCSGGLPGTGTFSSGSGDGGAGAGAGSGDAATFVSDGQAGDFGMTGTPAKGGNGGNAPLGGGGGKSSSAGASSNGGFPGGGGSGGAGTNAGGLGGYGALIIEY